MHFLALQSTYQSLELALFTSENLIAQATIDKHSASKSLIPVLNQLLSSNAITHNDLAFIAVNQGPGPFTTLRVLITTVNGIGFASCVPLVGIDGLAAFIEEQHTPAAPITLALLNAFNFDVYFALEQPNQPLQTGYRNIYLLLQEISDQFPQNSVRFIGNAVSMYAQDIIKLLGSRAHIPTPLPEFCSLQTIGLIGLRNWQTQEKSTYQLQPLYLKQFSAVMKQH